MLALVAASARAQDGDAAAGHASARQACNACHVVEAEQQEPGLIVIGPAFRDIANTRGTTAMALQVFLTTSHPKMPNLILTPGEIAISAPTFLAFAIGRLPDRSRIARVRGSGGQALPTLRPSFPIAFSGRGYRGDIRRIIGHTGALSPVRAAKAERPFSVQ